MTIESVQYSLQDQVATIRIDTAQPNTNVAGENHDVGVGSRR